MIEDFRRGFFGFISLRSWKIKFQFLWIRNVMRNVKFQNTEIYINFNLALWKFFNIQFITEILKLILVSPVIKNRIWIKISNSGEYKFLHWKFLSITTLDFLLASFNVKCDLKNETTEVDLIRAKERSRKILPLPASEKSTSLWSIRDASPNLTVMLNRPKRCFLSYKYTSVIECSTHPHTR